MESTSASRRTIPDEILEEIFLRLDAAADLVRVSATCSSFRRIVSARRFVRRFRSGSSTPVLGFLKYGRRDFLPVEPSHRSASEAHALVQAADFTFSFLPDPYKWHIQDARDGRVLLSRGISTKLWEFLVCDPLHRRYVKLPPIPDDLLVASTAEPHGLPILAPAAENDGEESFRVICTVKLQLEDKFMAFIFSSCNQTWRGIISTTEAAYVLDRSFVCKPYYAHNCFYWKLYGLGYLLIFDASEMIFSIIDLPSHNLDSECAIVEVADGTLGFLTIGDGPDGDGTVDLYYKNRQSNIVGVQEWQHDKLIPLPKYSGIKFAWRIVGIAGRYVAFCADCYDMENYEYFILDIKTLLVEKLCTSNDTAMFAFPYQRFPPPLALPSI